MKITTFIALTLLFVSTAVAQEKPETPKANGKIVFYSMTTLLAASKSADALTTVGNLDRGNIEYNPILGLHPSPARLAGFNAGYFAVQSAGFYFTEKSSHRWIRWAGRAYIGLTIADHAQLAACNANLPPNAPKSRRCHSLFPM